MSIAGFFLTLSIEGADASWQKHAFPFVATAIGATGISLAMKPTAPLKERQPFASPDFTLAGYPIRFTCSIFWY